MEKKKFSQVKFYIKDAYNRSAKCAASGNYADAVRVLLPAAQDAPEIPSVFERIREYEIIKTKSINPVIRIFFQIFSLFTALPIFLTSLKDPVKAMSMCETQLAKSVDQFIILQLLAKISEDVEAPWITVSTLEAIREFYPKNANTLRRLATAMQQNNQAGEALSIHRQLAHDAGDLASQNDLRSAMALASIEKGNWEEDADIDTAGERKVADSKEALVQQLLEGTIYDPSQAQVLIDKFTKDLENNDSVDIRRKLADAYIIVKDYSAAYTQYKLVGEKLGVIDPVLDKEIEKAYIAKLSVSVEELKNHPEKYENPESQITQIEEEIASYSLRHAVKRAKDFPNDAALQLDLGILYFDRGEYDLAEPIMKTALETAQTSRSALVYLGRLCIIREDWESAVKYLEEAVNNMYRLDKYKREALYYLAEACTKVDNTKRAVECYKLIYSSMKNYRDVPEKLAALGVTVEEENK